MIGYVSIAIIVIIAAIVSGIAMMKNKKNKK